MKREDARILIVDDEAALRGIFAKWLTNSGCHRVRTAANGEEAIEAIRQEPIDVLVTDVRMPIMDGVTLVRTLSVRGERVPTIIFVSGFEEVDRREMYNLGVESFLAKPFRLEELTSVIDSAITDREVLWVSPMEIPPRQTMHLSLPDLAADSAQEFGANRPSRPAEVSFSLGRGGFSARAEDPLALGKVSFFCAFTGDEPDSRTPPLLCGQGYVRWRSRLDHTVGVEFFYLESPGRQWVVQRIAVSNPSSFIPSLNPSTAQSESFANSFATLSPESG